MFSNLCEGDSVLFLGEGNFSFSLAAVKNNAALRTCRVVATCYECEPVSELARENAIELSELGVEVKASVDCSRLEELFPGRCFQLVAFMFPHAGGKMQIQRNRALLRGLGLGAAAVLAPGGRLAVALCGGQGGTEMDTVRRAADADTWQATRMLAAAGLQAVEVKSFRLEEHVGRGADYRSFGYRSLDKGFHTDKSVLHVFARSEHFEPSSSFLEDKLAALKGERPSEVGSALAKVLDELRKLDSNMTVLDPTAVETGCDFKEETTISSLAVRPMLEYDFDQEDFSRSPLRLRLAVFNAGDDAAKALENFPVIEERKDLTVLDLDGVCGGDSSKDFREAWAAMPNVSPPSYSHDLSFWCAASVPSLRSLRRLYWRHAGDFVVSLRLLDAGFVDAAGRTSVTLRVGLRCRRFAMGPELAWTLHRRHMGEVLEREFDVEIR